jgi:L-asparaginase II
MNWQSFEEGNTIGKTGNEGGVIIIDQEHIDGARLTLEQGCLRAPYAITCGVYGWMVHTRFIADDETAQHSVDEMKTALSEIMSLIPIEGDEDEGEKMGAVSDALEAFTERFP